QAESTRGKNIIIGEERFEPSKSHKEAPAKKIPEDLLKDSTLGGQEQKKGARSAQTGLETGLTGRSGRSGKNSRNNMEKIPETIRKNKGRVLKNSWPNMRRKESSRSRRDGQIRLRI